ncbi:MAG: L,D-transpeptidase family protein [Steroidobacteraceae bacterium]|jgi:murein L,D-transpeptidase YafK|nr:L,D-transpeptidase family protein [Steroidobacteraceae bacterium]
MSLLTCLRAAFLGGLLVVANGVSVAATPFVDSLPRTPGPAGSPLPPARPSAGDTLPTANRVLVRKSERRMYLMRGDEVLRSYRVALGLNPVGHKEREGDFRTPEGRYQLVKRNPRSDFFMSMKVSYPNPDDVARARRNGWAPGGSIMIHGLPNDPRKGLDYYATRDWTDGCIAVSNADMLEIWMLVSDGTTIDIQP